VRSGTSYSAAGLNKPNGDYVQVRIPGASPEQRWVRLGCGELRSAAGPGEPPDLPPDSGGNAGPGRKYLLAISWEPAFCETKPDKSECRSETPDRFDADHFVLHGLWPQPESNAYCGVPARDRSADERHDWDALPEPDVSSATRDQLEVAMPGTASYLQRHEWIKHGTCFGTNAEAYFRTALDLLDQVNRSKLREFVAGHIGDTVAVYQLKAEFERSFGPGAGAALSVRCSEDGSSRRQLIGEVWISLKGPLVGATPLQNALDGSVPARSTCDRAVVDRVGLD
jgi:ribonuclease T2